jgi:hypothetical protein
MTSELTPRIKQLCILIAKEKDQKKFLQLAEELNQLLAEKEESQAVGLGTLLSRKPE